MDEKKCSKCGGQMELGTMAGHFAAGWFKGDLNKNPMFTKTERKNVHALACQTCGFIELYVENAK